MPCYAGYNNWAGPAWEYCTVQQLTIDCLNRSGGCVYLRQSQWNMQPEFYCFLEMYITYHCLSLQNNRIVSPSVSEARSL